MVLASVHTQTLARAVNTWVEQLPKKLSATGTTESYMYWVGAQDDVTEATWYWLNGARWSYTKWAFLQPDNYYNEDCMVVIAGQNGGEWNDQNCDLDRPFVCTLSKLHSPVLVNNNKCVHLLND